MSKMSADSVYTELSKKKAIQLENKQKLMKYTNGPWNDMQYH